MILAHAFGARYDLPIPLALFVVGGGVVVLISFMLVARRQPFDGAEQARPAEQLAPPLRPIPGVLGLALLGFLIWVGFAGEQSLSENILPTAFWLLAWIAIPLSCG